MLLALVHSDLEISFGSLIGLHVVTEYCFFLSGSVDAFSVTLSPKATNYHPIVANKIFKFDVVTVNIRGGYSTETGEFGIIAINIREG